jgi:hypothetical protein
MVRQQVRVMAYLDVFWVFAVMSLVALLLVLLMKKSVAKGGCDRALTAGGGGIRHGPSAADRPGVNRRGAAWSRPTG